MPRCARRRRRRSSSARSAAGAWCSGGRRERHGALGRWSWPCPAGTTCRTRWPRSRSASASGCDFTRVADGAGRFPRRGAPIRARTAKRAACWWSTTTAITRRRLPRCWRPRGPTLDRRIVVAFQPHRYSRTRNCSTQFGPALAEADEIVLTDIYPAGEEPIPGITVEALGRSRSARGVGPPGARRAGTEGRRAHVVDDRPARRRRDHTRRRLDRHGAEDV